jgi:hypothetical protein
MSVTILICLFAGCANIKGNNFLKQKYTHVYFQKGVYETYSADEKNEKANYFYVFNDENTGHTENSSLGIGLPFSCKQTDNSVQFKFGGVDEPDKVFKIKSVQNGLIEGSFEDGQLIKFVPITNVNPDKFDALEYMKNEN